MPPFDPERVEKNARQATTPDLVDRVTVYRDGMEPEALSIIEAELQRRGVDWQQVDDRHEALVDANGVAWTCSFCRAPAVAERWGWHWLWSVVPLFPWRRRYCQEHQRY